MKKFFILAFMFSSLIAFSQNPTLSDLPNFGRYAKSNQEIGLPKKNEKRVVFIGNSITDGWPNQRPDFFKNNDYVGRGIGGQTSGQLLLRFQQDVINLKPVAVVINIGTNDIAENTGKYNPDFTFDNIKSMAEIAKANKIKVILSSILPVGEYPWRKEIKNVPQTIDTLNARIKDYAEKNKFAYIDYNTPMRTSEGALIAEYGDDGVHPNQKGYEVMEKIAKKVVDKVVK